jgi:hypothetical protein
MNENEVILVDQIPNNIYDSLIKDCIKYAIISKPFTIRRIRNQSLEQAILNIFKGKIAEALFQFFCNSNNINLDWNTCTTPFWQVDKRDFILNSNEWDIKNNFLYHRESVLQNHRYIDLPCLIPNRFQPSNNRSGDQWSTRNEIKNNGIGLTGVSYIFSFLKAADLDVNGQRGTEFYNFNITHEQIAFIGELERKYNGLPTQQEPFTEEWFWQEMVRRGSLDFIHLNFRPYLIITGYADNNSWTIFRDTGHFDSQNNWQTYLQTRWYTKTAKGSINFMNGTLWTTITNATAPTSQLNSFLSLSPQLRDQMNYGRLKQ